MEVKAVSINYKMIQFFIAVVLIVVSIIWKVFSVNRPRSYAFLRIDEQECFVRNGTLTVEGGNNTIRECNFINKLPFIKLTVSSKDCHPPDHDSSSNTSNLHAFSKIKTPTPDATQAPSKFGRLANNKSSAISYQILSPNQDINALRGPSGSEFHSDKVIPHNIVQKGFNAKIESYSAFGDSYGDKLEKTNINNMLKEFDITHVIIGGLAKDYGVLCTALDAIKNGYKVCVPLWATRSINDDTGNEAEKKMCYAGVFLAKDMDELNKWLESDNASSCTCKNLNWDIY